MSPEAAMLLSPGDRIANARGVPGTAGCLVAAPGETAMLLTNHHVLFGAGGETGEPVWALGEDDGPHRFRRAGSALRGQVGAVGYEGEDHHVDCALIALERPATEARRWLPRPRPRRAPRPLRSGDRVFKLGGATGATEGKVIATDHPAVAEIDGRTHPAPHQILVRSCRGERFSAPGDSGSALRDADGVVVGLLWGSTDRGDSLACHIGPVLDCLGVRPAAPIRRRVARSVAFSRTAA